MKRILWGLVIAVAPVLAAGFGALMARLHGRTGFTDLVQWSFVLLVISIPLGAVLVVSGAIRTYAEYRARRAAGITDPEG